MKTIPFEFLSADGRSMLSAVIWEPETAPRGILQLTHGITEHMGRYEDFARRFTALGYAVAGHNHLGHGKAAPEEGFTPMYFGPDGSWRHVVKDVQACGAEVRRRYPGLPLCLLGFSLGSFAARCLLGDAPNAADMTVWVGTGQLSALETGLAGWVVRREERLHGDKGETPLLRKLTLESYNSRFQPRRTEADWLYADPRAAQAYLSDPLVGPGFTVGSFRELLRGMKACRPKNHAAKMRRNMPILLLSGGEDPVGGRGMALKKLLSQLKKLHFSDVEAILLPALRHDVLHDGRCEEAFSPLVAWLDKRMPRA